MVITIFLSLLMLSALLFEGIGTLSEENIKHLHIRKKRVVDLTRRRSRPELIENHRFIVSVQRNGGNICGASILSPTVVITAAHCLEILAEYKILSGSSHHDRGIDHNITKIIFHPGYRPDDFPHDLVLLIIFPAIDLDKSPNRKIMMYNGDVAPGTPGIVTGWGSTSLKRLSYPGILRSITVPIISLELCQHEFQGQIEISNQNICTWHISGQRCCNTGDSGSPLVVNGKLVGVYGGTAGTRRFLNKPDVFMKVTNPEYRDWIISNLQQYPDNPYNLLNPHSPRSPRLLHM